MQLDATNIEQLHRRQELLTNNLRQGKASILTTLEDEVGIILDKINDLKDEFRKSKNDFLEISVLERRETQTVQREKTGIFNSIISFFTGPRYEYREIEVVTHYARVQDAIEQIESFADECIHQTERRMLDIINLRKLNQRVAKSAIDLFDSGDADFDLAGFRMQVKRCLNEFVPPRIEFSTKDILYNITQKFGQGSVSQDYIKQLQMTHKQSIGEVLHQIEFLIEHIKDEVEKYFIDMEKNLLENLIAHVEEDVQRMREQVSKKESSIAELQEFKHSVEQISV